MDLKKNENRDLSKFRTLFRNVGLVVTLILTITAFEWKWEQVKIPDIFYDSLNDDIMAVTPVTTHYVDIAEPPKPEPNPNAHIKIVPDDVPILKKVDVKPAPVNLEKLIGSAVEPPEPISNMIVDWAEVSAEPEVGITEFRKKIADYCAKNYPKRDLRAGIKGRTFVEFIVEKDGSLTSVKIKKGFSLSKSLDALAIKSIRNNGSWKAGKQTGRPVRQRMIMPISFQ